ASIAVWDKDGVQLEPSTKGFAPGFLSVTKPATKGIAPGSAFVASRPLLLGTELMPRDFFSALAHPIRKPIRRTSSDIKNSHPCFAEATRLLMKIRLFILTSFLQTLLQP